jgi:hypothetical protein
MVVVVVAAEVVCGRWRSVVESGGSWRYAPNSCLVYFLALKVDSGDENNVGNKPEGVEG